MSQPQYPIDIIITWVDGNDPVWQAEKDRYSGKTSGDTRQKRYREWDSLKYLFRGIEKFAPWVNRVFLVTCGHLPEWLNTENPKFRHIRHSDYIPAEYLPTFSSRPIDMNFHRIEELSEHFIYFNDDMFLIRPVEPSDFFENGLPCDSAIQDVICPKWRTDDKQLGADHLFSAVFYDTAVLNRNFKKKSVIRKNRGKWFSPKYGRDNFKNLLLMRWNYFTGFKSVHYPYSYLTSTYRDVWAAEPDMLSAACAHRFRTPTDVNHFIFSFWQMAQGNFSPRALSAGRLAAITGDEARNESVYRAIRAQKVKFMCVNDHFSGDNFEAVKAHLNQSLEAILPEKSGFER